MSSERFINHAPFSRLRWNVFGNFDEILVEEREGKNVVALLPFKDHPITTEPATLSGLCSLEINIEELEVRQGNDELDVEDGKYLAPAPLRLKKDEGQPITVEDIVGSLHMYLNTHKNDIVEYFNEMAGDDAMVEAVDGAGNSFPKFDIQNRTMVFKSLVGEDMVGEDVYSVAVSLFWDGEFGTSLEEFWKTRPHLPR
ncbi:hypothetical protein EJ08DRAFT_735288 [Tothia fuscella]|uniref:Uncharacterized protein n=1 Tax=Tothia fuscella TaxID=1048955 RepID=A0A9P4NP72_9PEZI|nr:hypothetical protein EJ08DRAFT_735288 [Tothia fuscella]